MTSPLINRPDYLHAIGAVDAEWATIEYSMLMLFQLLMGVDSPRAHAVFSELSNHRLRRDVLMGVARAVLAGREEFDQLRRLLLRVGKLSVKRNIVAHATWGTRGQDVVILDPRRNWRPVPLPLAELSTLAEDLRELHFDMIQLFKSLHALQPSAPGTAVVAVGPSEDEK